MSIVSEAHVLYIDQCSQQYPFYGIVISSARRAGRGQWKANEAQNILEKTHTEWLDNKVTSESIYASSELERFKQDTLPDVVKKLKGHD